MTDGAPDWPAALRRIVAEQRRLFERLSSAGERTRYEEVGEGGDRTLELDRLCEDVVLQELERLARSGPSLAVVAEERGEVTLGGSEPSLRVVVDPIDGSLNMRRTLPSHSVSIAVARGDTLADVELGFVHDFGADEEFLARRGDGAHLDGRPLVVSPAGRLEVVGLESAKPAWVAPMIAALDGEAYRLRAVGSIAISMSYVAASRFDAMASARPCRSVDAAAAALVVAEAGGAVEVAGLGLDEAGLGLDARYPVAAALDPAMLETVRAAQDRALAAAGSSDD